MRIGFDVSQTGASKAGCGHFADGLIRALSETDSINEYLLFPVVGGHFWDPDASTGTFRSSQSNFRRMPAPKDQQAAKSLWSSSPEDLEAHLGAPDIFHANNFFCPRGLTKAKLIYTLYDLSFLEEPRWTTEANRTACFEGAFEASLLADGIIAISRFSRDHFLATFPHYPPNHIRVVYPGSRFESRENPPRPERFRMLEPERFWLNVGTIEPRKNHWQLVEAFARFRSNVDARMPLVLAGGQGWLMEDFQQRLSSLNLGSDQVIITGYLDDTELRWLYENCFCFVYPSLFEGFGLPILEAMKLGAAVICSNASSIPEIVGQAGILVDPHDMDQLAHAMKQIVEDKNLHHRLRREAYERSKIFSWTTSAGAVLELYGETFRGISK